VVLAYFFLVYGVAGIVFNICECCVACCRATSQAFRRESVERLIDSDYQYRPPPYALHVASEINESGGPADSEDAFR
jgi:Fe-S-cluster containining protein